MKSTIKLFGTGHGKGAFSPILSIKPSEARWSTRTFIVYGPVPEELKNLHGSAPVDSWLEFLATGNLACLDHESAFIDPPNRLCWDSVVMPARASLALSRAVQLTSRDSPRNYGTVVNFETGAFAGTDGFRLYQESDFPMLPRGISIPGDAAKFIAKATKGHETSWMVSLDGCLLCVAWGAWQVFVRLSAVKYPKYRSLIPKLDKLYAHLSLDASHEARSQATAMVKAFPKGPAKDNTDIYFTALTTGAGVIRVNPRFFLDGCDMKSDWYASIHDAEANIIGKIGEHGTYLICPVKKPAEERKRA